MVTRASHWCNATLVDKAACLAGKTAPATAWARGHQSHPGLTEVEAAVSQEDKEKPQSVYGAVSNSVRKAENHRIR